MDPNFYMERGKKYNDEYKKLKKINPELAEKYRKRAKEYLTMDKEYKKRKPQSIPSDEEIKKEAKELGINLLKSEQIIQQKKQNKTKKKKEDQIEMEQFNKPTGFTETLVRKEKEIQMKLNKQETCSNIFNNGLKLNNKYFYPSEFPNLTNIKPLIISKKRQFKGGKRNTRKTKPKVNCLA